MADLPAPPPPPPSPSAPGRSGAFDERTVVTGRVLQAISVVLLVGAVLALAGGIALAWSDVRDGNDEEMSGLGVFLGVLLILPSLITLVFAFSGLVLVGRALKRQDPRALRVAALVCLGVLVLPLALSLAAIASLGLDVVTLVLPATIALGIPPALLLRWSTDRPRP